MKFISVISKEESGRLKLKAENQYADNLRKWMEVTEQINAEMNKELAELKTEQK